MYALPAPWSLSCEHLHGLYIAKTAYISFGYTSEYFTESLSHIHAKMPQGQLKLSATAVIIRKMKPYYEQNPLHKVCKYFFIFFLMVCYCQKGANTSYPILTGFAWHAGS